MSPLTELITGAKAYGWSSFIPSPPSSFYSIATATPSGTNQVIFSSIPSSYKHLQIRTFTRVSGTNGSSELEVSFNGNTTNNYTFRGIFANSSDGIGTWDAPLNNNIRATDANFSDSNWFGTSIIDVIDYNSTTKQKMIKTMAGGMGTWTGASTARRVGISSGIWNNNSAITSITINSPAGAFQAGSVIALYGIEG